MKRRKFLLLSASGVAAIVFPSVSTCNSSVEYPDALALPGEISKIRNSEQVEAIGNAYLENAPGQTNKRALVRSLSNNAPSDSTAIPGFMQQQITQDFETDNTVLVEGWILSETEAQQCALFALEQTN